MSKRTAALRLGLGLTVFAFGAGCQGGESGSAEREPAAATSTTRAAGSQEGLSFGVFASREVTIYKSPDAALDPTNILRGLGVGEMVMAFCLDKLSTPEMIGIEVANGVRGFAPTSSRDVQGNVLNNFDVSLDEFDRTLAPCKDEAAAAPDGLFENNVF